MIKNKLNILLNLFLDNSDESDEDIRSYFIQKGEDPDMIINRAIESINQRDAALKLKEGKEKQNKAKEVFTHFKPGTIRENTTELSGISYAYRNKSGELNQEDKEELRVQAEKINELKKHLDK